MLKMEYLSNDLAELNAPDQAALNAYFLAHKDKYELPDFYMMIWRDDL